MDQRSERRNVVASGKTVEEAIRNGLQMLGVRRDEVEAEIITEGSRGVLGFGAENARVRLVVKAPPKPEPVKTVAEPVKVTAPTPAPAPEIEVIEGEEPTAEQVGREVLGEVLHLMGVRATVETQMGYELADEDEEPPVVLNITGEDLGILIGRRGETLRALQYLVRLMVSHRLKHWTNLVVDVENYLVRRRRSLESLANRVADQAVRSGRVQAMEPMPAYERRLVHIALRKNPKVTTQSIGEGERRKVTIVPKQ
ncbi:MAG: protein jag [Anaerolineae bacterium]|nr:protein jag [Anaerolineae bacterium]